MTVREHLKSFHKSEAAHHKTMAAHHMDLQKAHSDLADHYENDSALSALHKAVADTHKATGTSHEKAAERHLAACDKIGDLETVKVVPTGASGINRGADHRVEKIIRPGQPEQVDKTGVPAEMEQFVDVA